MRTLLLSSGLTALLLLPLTASAQATLQPDAVNPDSMELPSMDCIVEPSQIVELGTGVPGIIDKIYFEKNDFITAGEVVAELDSRVELATLELANARASIDTALNLRRKNADFGLRTQKRNQKLFKESTISAPVSYTHLTLPTILLV